MEGMVVVALPSWLVWLVIGLALAKIAQNGWHIWRLKRLDKHYDRTDPVTWASTGRGPLMGALMNNKPLNTLQRDALYRLVVRHQAPEGNTPPTT